MLIAVYLLDYLKFSRYRVATREKTKILLVAGAACGLAALTVGAIGAVISPFIDALELKKERAVAAIATVSVFSNVVKLPLILLIYDQLDWLIAMMIGSMIVATVVGVSFGKRIHEYVSETLFSRMFRMALTVIGLKLLVWDGLGLVLL